MKSEENLGNQTGKHLEKKWSTSQLSFCKSYQNRVLGALAIYVHLKMANCFWINRLIANSSFHGNTTFGELKECIFNAVIIGRSKI